MTYHRTVLAKECLKFLSVIPGKWYLDGTLGDGGHSLLIAAKGGYVWGNDQDDEALNRAKARLEDHTKDSVQVSHDPHGPVEPTARLILTRGNFEDMANIWQQLHLPPLNGILLDLGASTLQLMSISRGFSFVSNAPLDMRMDRRLGVTAADLLNALSARELGQMFAELGGERMSKKIAEAIVAKRKTTPFRTTQQLADLVSKLKSRVGRLHPATKVFQALRMAVNSEHHALTKALPAALQILAPKGRLAIIAFHEGEDRIVKRFFKQNARINKLTILTPKPVTPTGKERNQNPRSRSAKLRVAAKI